MLFPKERNKKTILHLIPNFVPGGAENQLRIIASRSISFTHIIISLKNVSPQYMVFDRNLQVIYLNLNKNPISFLNCCYNLIINIYKYKPEVINLWMYHAQLLSIPLKAIYHAKYVWCVRHSTFSKYTKRTTIIISNINSFFSRLIPDLIIYNSESGKITHERKGYHRYNGIVISNGGNDNFTYSKDIRRNQRMNWLKDDNFFIVGTIARYSPQKSIKLLIEVFSACFKNNDNVVLVLCGRNMDNKNIELVSLLQEKDIYNKTVLIGQTNQVNKVLNGLDLYLSTSSYGEGFPNILLEAKYTGLEVISSDVGDSGRILGENDDIIEIGNKELFIESIKNKYYLYLKNNKTRCPNRVNESKKYRNIFTSSEMVNSYEKEWRKLICI